MIIYSESQDWINYAKAFGALMQDILYFEYDVVASSLVDSYQKNSQKGNELISDIIYHETSEISD